MLRVSRGRQVTFDKLPVGAKPWPQKIFKKFLSFFGSKKIKVTVKPIYKKLFFLYEKSIRKNRGQIPPPHPEKIRVNQHTSGTSKVNWEVAEEKGIKEDNVNAEQNAKLTMEDTTRRIHA